jgi:hypothetical protein
MAKRFLNSEFYRDTWFMDLPLKYKMFYLYLIGSCSHAGIWQVNFREANLYVGEQVEPAECLRHLKGRITLIEDGKYWFIPKFIEFQYGEQLNIKNRVHAAVIASLKKFGISSDVCSENSFETEPYEKKFAPSENLNTINNKCVGDLRVSPDPKEKETDKDMVKDLEKNMETGKEEEREPAAEPEVPAKEFSLLADLNKLYPDHHLKLWINQNAPRVNMLKQPLNNQECQSLLEEFDESVIKEVLLDMENYEKLFESYHNANLTIRKWIRCRKKTKPSLINAPEGGLKFTYFDPLAEMEKEMNAERAAELMEGVI